MANTIENRSEILFLYEIENANPNGDPLNENRPRFDTEDARALVSDVRLKRTIRDYWFERKGYDGTDGKDIFVRETKYEDKGKEFVSDGKRRAEAFRKDKKTPRAEFVQNILDTCIDIRTFGGVIPLDKSSITRTGPVQFQMGKSLHATSIETIQGTGAFASSSGKQQSTFRTEYILPYALIGFNGIVNEQAAKYTGMSADDRDLVLEGIWEGTKNLISRSKFGQSPMLLLHITYKDGYYLGNLRQRVQLLTEKRETEIRGTEDYRLDLTRLFDALRETSERVESIELRVDNRLELLYNGAALTTDNGKINLNDLR